MFKRGFFSLAAVIAVIAILFSARTSKSPQLSRPSQWPGRNNTALFLSNSEHGLANVLLATSHALIVDHPDIKVSFVTFPKLAKDITTINKFASQRNAAVQPITFYPLAGPSYTNALDLHDFQIRDVFQAPGIAGLSQFLRNLQIFLMPWSAPDYLSLYKEVLTLLSEIDPLIVAVDPIFGPGLDAVRANGRNHVIISPNALKDNFAIEQGLGRWLWEYPAISSGYPYPVPLHLIPSNIYLTLRFVYSTLMMPKLSAKKSYLRQHGIAKPLDMLSIYQPLYPWLSQSLPEIDFPISVIPASVVPCGPIYLSVASAADQDPNLASWLQRAPTVLINLGSATNYDEIGAFEMAKAIKLMLDQTQVQVLWKFNKRTEFGDEFLKELEFERISGRLRLENWLVVDPASLLETGNVIVSVHHGGANCYHEAVGTGVPQLVLPLWVDLYEYATRVEYLGIGLWGNKRTAPNWTAEELGDAFLRMVQDADETKEMRRKAKQLARLSKIGGEGRVKAAGVVANLARMS